MASLSTHASTGLVRICFKHPDGKRKAIYLGRISKRNGSHVLEKVKQLLDDLSVGRSHGPEIATWISVLDDDFRTKFERVGLLGPRATPPTIKQLAERCLRSPQLAASTKATYRQTSASLYRAFGADRRIDKISCADAARWQDELAADELAVATIGKRTNVAKSLFSRAVEWEMLGENPFRSLRSGSQENAERIHHIRPELFLRVIRSMESPKWRLLFALLRFAGLRCPSELKPLEWSDVDWHPGRKSIRVRSPKTRKHSGHQHRLVPITKELQPFVVEAFEAAGKPSGPIFPNLESATRIRERLLKALNKLGIERWPRLMQNLRASCVIDWAQRWPLPEVTRWSGHSISVAMAHYLTTLDSNFREAVGASDWIRSSEPPSEPESGPNPSLTPDPRDQDEHSPPTPNPVSVPPVPGARRARPPRRTQGASRPIRGPASSGKNSPGYS